MRHSALGSQKTGKVSKAEDTYCLGKQNKRIQYPRSFDGKSKRHGNLRHPKQET